VPTLRAPLTASDIVRLRYYGEKWDTFLYALGCTDEALMKTLQNQCLRGRTPSLVVVVSTDGQRGTIEVYHRNQLAMNSSLQQKCAARHAAALGTGLSKFDHVALVDAALVPQKTWIYGVRQGFAGLERLPPEKLYLNAFLIQEMDAACYSVTFPLTEEWKRCYVEADLK